MGLSSTLSNALSGMNASQRGIEVVSRNVANSGTPGYHRQSVVLAETHYGQASQVRLATVQRAFDEALQKQHIVSVSDSSFHDVRAQFLDRLQIEMGKPGDAHSLDTLYSAFENALQSLATTPDDAANRATVLNAAQAMVERLNGLSGAVQDMRRETELQISDGVAELNRSLKSLADVNVRILDVSVDQQARLAMMDERDRLVSSISELVDVNVSFRDNGTVSLMTKSGVGLLDNQPSSFEFSSGGTLSPTGNTGALEVITPGGRAIEVTDLLTSGRMAGLIELRDTTLVNTQNQLDEIAAGFALAMSTLPSDTGVEEVSAGTYTVDLAAMEKGNGFALTYLEGGVEKTVRVVNSDVEMTDPANANASGERVIQLDLGQDVADIAAALQTALGTDFTFADSGGLLSVTGDDVTLAAVTTQITATAEQGGTALPLFVENDGTAYTGNPDDGGQMVGFAARISINQDLVSDTSLLVKSTATTSLGDPSRPQFLLDNLKSMRFTSENVTALRDGGVRLSGRLGELVGQTINYQGNTVARGFAMRDNSALTLEAITNRMEASYGVDIDQEMAGLMELQNAYAASARVVSTVQELIDRLLAI